MTKVLLINLLEMRTNISSFIRKDRNDPDLRNRTIWYEWNLTMNCIQALDTEEAKRNQLENYSKMGYRIVQKIPEQFGNLSINKIILRKDPEFKPDYYMHTDYSEAFGLCFGYAKAQYEHIIIEVPAKNMK